MILPGYRFSVTISGTVYILGLSFVWPTAGVTLNNGDLSLTLGISIQDRWLPNEEDTAYHTFDLGQIAPAPAISAQTNRLCRPRNPAHNWS